MKCPHLLPSLPVLRLLLTPNTHPCKKRAQFQLEKIRVLDKQECPYLGGRFESSQNKSCEIKSNQRRLQSGGDAAYLGQERWLMGGLTPCGAAIAQTGGKRSWDHETGKAVDRRRWKQKETRKCLKSYQRDPAVFSSLPLSIGSLALGLRVLLSQESMEGVNLSLSCYLDQVGIHIELIQPSKRPSPAFHCKGICWRKSVSLNSLGFLSINSSVGECWKEGTGNGVVPGKVFILAFPWPRKVSALEKSTSPCTKLYGGG